MSKLKILILEDLVADADLIQKYLIRNKMKFEATIIASKAELMKALEDIQFDIILGDHSSSSIQALKMAREKDKSVPFILVSELISEEEAIRIVQEKGADDYILIDRMKRLPTAIRQAVKNRLVKLGKELCEDKLLEKSMTDAFPINM
jgi:CheY-like chemotaxis protein